VQKLTGFNISPNVGSHPVQLGDYLVNSFKWKIHFTGPAVYD